MCLFPKVPSFSVYSSVALLSSRPVLQLRALPSRAAVPRYEVRDSCDANPPYISLPNSLARLYCASPLCSRPADIFSEISSPCHLPGPAASTASGYLHDNPTAIRVIYSRALNLSAQSITWLTPNFLGNYLAYFCNIDQRGVHVFTLYHPPHPILFPKNQLPFHHFFAS
jgi:hypothetical protein